MKDQNLSLDLLHGLVITWINTSNKDTLIVYTSETFFLTKH